MTVVAHLKQTMKKTLSILAFLILTNLCFGQDYKTEFDKSCQAGDTTKQIELDKVGIRRP